MRVISLETERIRRLNVVRINLNEEEAGPIFIVGNNDEGKSSTLDSMMLALCGGRIADPIRHGETQGEIRLALGDEEVVLTVRKVFKEGQAPRLIVKTADGMTGSQASLDAILGAIGVDPVALANMDAVAQAEAILSALGVDMTDLDDRFARIHEERKTLNRWVRDNTGTLKAFVADPDTPDTEVVVQDLMNELEAINAENRDYEVKRQLAIDAMEAVNSETRRASEKADEVLRLTEQLDRVRLDAQEAQEAQERAQAELLQAEADSTAATQSDPDPVKAQIAQADTINTAIRAKKANSALVIQVDDAKAKSLDLTNELSAIEVAKTDRVIKAGLPEGLRGIAFTDDGMTFEGFPLANLGTGKRLRVATQIVIALNPKLKVLLIKAGNDLDRHNLRAILETAEEAGFQVWIESVFKRDAYGPEIEIVDGTAEFGNWEDVEDVPPSSEPGHDGTDEEVEAAKAKVVKKKTDKAAQKAPSAADMIRDKMRKEGRLL